MKNIIETVVGLIVIASAIIFIFIAYKSGNIESNIANSYSVVAHFERIDGIRAGSEVRISGIKVGSIINTSLDNETFNAVVEMSIPNAIQLPTDTSAEILSDNLIGQKYISLVPGADTETLTDGSRIEFTQSTISIESLIARFMFGSAEDKK